MGELMTIINKLSATGFKSFSKKTEVPFGNNFNCIIGSNGSGKSCKHDTLVTLSNGSEIKIGDLVENNLKKSNRISKLDDGIYCESSEPIEIISLNPETMKAEFKKISKFIKREGEPFLYKIKTRSGKSLTCTGCHPVMIYKEGKVQSSLVENLSSGELISTPREIKLVNKENNEDLARLFGYIIGDGYITNNRIEFVNKDFDILEDFKFLVRKLFNSCPRDIRESKNTTRFIYSNKNFLEKIKSHIPNKENKYTSQYKYIPDFILKSNEKTVSNVIAGLYDTDGHIGKRSIEFCTKNEKLANQLQILLLRYGINSIKRTRLCFASNTLKKIKRKYTYLYINGYENMKKFFINIPLTCKYKKTNLEKLILDKKNSNPNVDLIPQEVNRLIKKSAELLGLNIKQLSKKHSKLKAYCYNDCNPSRNGLIEILGLFKTKFAEIIQEGMSLKLDQLYLVKVMDSLAISGCEVGRKIGVNPHIVRNYWAKNIFKAKPENLDNFFNFIQTSIKLRLVELKENISTLHNLAYSDIYWDEIVEIEKVKGEKYVYDLTIPDNHNFIANGLHAHNSNLGDLVCFVLGKTSAKSLRAEKSANLIYNGGKKDKPAKFAEASVHFDNTKKLLPFEEKEVRLTRKVNKNGVSEYRINDKKVNRQQVVDMLSSAGIDPDGHNIVLQGDIVHFMEMKPVDRRFLVEEIAGISVYDERKNKAMNDLGKVEEKLTEANIILTEREANLRELKKDRDQAQKYKELQSKIKDNKATFLSIRMKEKKESIGSVETRLTKNNEKLEKINSKIESFRNNIDDDQKRISEINKNLDEKGEHEQKILQMEISILRSDIIKYEERINTLQNEEIKTQDRIKQLKKNVDLENLKKVESLENEKKKLKLKLNKVVNEEEKLSKDVDDFKKKHGLDNLSNFNFKLDEIDKEVDNTNLNISKKQEEKQNLIREKDRLEFELENVNKEISKFNEFNKKNNFSKVKKDFDSISKELGKLLNEDSALSSNLTIYRNQHDENQSRISKLNASALTIREHSHGNLALRKIKSLDDKNIYGTISELGNVKSKYSLALEVAAGPRMKSVVVKDDLTAAKCIKYLKENKLGVVTFIPLNKINSPLEDKSVKNLVKQKGVENLAINLVDFDSRFKKAFSYALGNTLIVDDVNTARKLGIGRARMVTLQGDLVEKSGAMVGGYRARNTGLGFNQKEINSELNELEIAQKQLQKKMQNNISKRNELEKLIISARNKRGELEGEIIKIQNSVGLTQDINDLEKNSGILMDKVKELNVRMKNLKLEEDYKKLELLKKSKIKVKESTLKDKNVSSNLVNKESKLMELKEEKIRIDSEVKRINNQVSMYEDENDKIRKIIQNHQKELEDFKEELENIYEVMDKKKDSLKEKEEQEKEFYGQFKRLASERNKLMNDLQENEKKSRDFEFELNKVRDVINDISIKRAKVVSELEGLEAEFELVKDGKIRRGVNLEQLKQEINQFDNMAKNIGNVNMRALEIYDDLKQEYDQLVSKSDKLKSEKDSVLEMINEIETRKTGEFMKTFNKLNEKFKEIYLKIATKGEASLILENKEKPLEGGLDISVKFGNNKYLDIRSLSGGEKTMAALSFIFSIQDHKPASFYLLDEVDAALDKHNSEKLSKLINEYSKRAQYVVISHNDAIITEADQIYGVSMQDGISKITSLKI